MKTKYATAVYENNGYMVVKYHKTEIVQFNSEEITLNSDGWYTATTKRRMNEVSETFNLGYHVFSKKSKWYVNFKDETIEFVDSMVLNTSVS